MTNPFSQSSPQSKSAHGRRSRAGKRRTSPRVEPLEDRIVMSTFNVNTTLDSDAVNLRTGKDATGHISLRSAIMTVDAHKGSNTIRLRPGTYNLTIAGTNEDASATGDLDINGNVTIQGSGASRTIINANFLDRVFEILGGNVKISGVSIENGSASVGGGLLNVNGRVSLSSVAIIGNRAVGTAGEGGEAGATESGANGGNGTSGANGTGALGGGIFNGGSLTIAKSTVTGNHAFGGDGGFGGNGGEASGQNSGTGAGQSVIGGTGGNGGAGADARGGGIYNAQDGNLVISGTVVASNEAIAGTGGDGGNGGDAHGGIGGVAPGSAAQQSGDALGGIGGTGGAGGTAKGGGLFNLGTVSLQGSTTTFGQNLAQGGGGGGGGRGGEAFGGGGVHATGNNSGDTAGAGTGGLAGAAGSAGDGDGGGIDNDVEASFTSTTEVVVVGNGAFGGRGGTAANGGNGIGGDGGDGSGTGNGGAGGAGNGGNAGSASNGGNAFGGGMNNEEGATVVFRSVSKRSPSTTSVFQGNQAVGGAGNDGGDGGFAEGGHGGAGGGTTGDGGNGGRADAGGSTPGSQGGTGFGGGLANSGSASFTGISVNFQSNIAMGGKGSVGGDGGDSSAGNGGNGFVGGDGLNSTATNGSNGGAGGDGLGGGIWSGSESSLTLNPQLGATKRSKQAHAVDIVTLNQAIGGAGGLPGAAGAASGGTAGTPGGKDGLRLSGQPGNVGSTGMGIGGGFFEISTAEASLANTNIAGNSASTSDNDVADIAILQG